MQYLLLPRRPPPVSFSDNFNRADGPMGDDWSGTSDWVISGNMAVLTGAGAWRGNWHDLGVADHYASAKCYIASGAPASVAVRVTDNNNAYFAFHDVASSCTNLYKRVAGAFTVLATATGQTWTDGDVMKITAVGTTITLYQSGEQVLQVTDSALSGTGVGIYSYHPDSACDDFESEEL